MNAITDLLQHKRLIWRGSQQQNGTELVPSGYPQLDQALGGGLPQHGVIEIRSACGIGELRLLTPYIRQQCPKRLTVFINPPAPLCADFLAQQEIDLEQVIQIFPTSPQHALWAAEQCLKSGACGTVSLWHSSLEIHQTRRLQVASETGQCLQVWFNSEQISATTLPVSLRLQLSADKQGLNITVSKRKGGWLQNRVTLDMSAQWPALTSPVTPTRVLPFPARRRSQA